MGTKGNALAKKEQKIAAQIKSDNAAYEAMGPMERRVAVSKEIITMLRIGSFVPGTGYGRVERMNGEHAELPLVDPKWGKDSDRFDFPFGDLQPIIRAGGFECVGCAKAAVIVARASVGNQVKITKRSLNEDGLAERLANKVSHEVFGTTADIIEGLYENWSLEDDGSPNFFRTGRRLFGKDEKRIGAYEKMRERLSDIDSDDRMRAIYRNVIKNEGYLNIGGYKY